MFCKMTKLFETYLNLLNDKITLIYQDAEQNTSSFMYWQNIRSFPI
jgi:hypothetical protein